MKNGKLEILTWHVHGNYLYYLTQVKCLFYIPVKYPKTSGYFGLTKSFNWGNNVKEIPAEKVKDIQFDCIIFQSNFSLKDPNYDFLQDQIAILSKKQLRYTPKLFIEHDPPRKHPTDTKHRLYNSEIPVVHVTHFNKLMWDTGTTPTSVISHGVTLPKDISYSGEIEKGVVVINNLSTRGRRLGLDMYEKVKKDIPLDLIGTGSDELGGLGEIAAQKLPFLLSKYRFLFHPARYTSLSLSIIEAMMVGLPIIGFATTELATVIQNGVHGYIHTDINFLIHNMHKLLDHPDIAKNIGGNARKHAQQNFSIERFTEDWLNFIKIVLQTSKKKEQVTNLRLLSNYSLSV